MPSKDACRDGEKVAHCALMAFTTLDGNPPEDAHQGAPANHVEERHSATSTFRGGTPSHEAHPVDVMSLVRRHLQARGILTAGVLPMTASTQRGESSLHLALWWMDVNRFLRGVFNLRPPMPRYTQTLDVKLVLEQLCTLEPLCTLTLKELTLKLVMLMALTQAARVQTLHLLVLKNIRIGETSICVSLGDNIKQCHPKFNVKFVNFTAYATDKRLCVCETATQGVAAVASGHVVCALRFWLWFL
ncbi:uncharacterized protein LOC123498642 [Portunus trituberculatus]|uniref:uncharacterized protein LOC123498642 n=1 Tax=Portunus trituberculatus TaxID=210409 RepID=UPI001E1CC860|nr:uncharacterized protein LOC123498642 [Portunus trituberculatus]